MLWAVAFVIALAWRIEVEWRGWHGLGWIGYTHLAIPFGGMLFLAWVWWASKSHEHGAKIVALVAL